MNPMRILIIVMLFASVSCFLIKPAAATDEPVKLYVSTRPFPGGVTFTDVLADDDMDTTSPVKLRVAIREGQAPQASTPATATITQRGRTSRKSTLKSFKIRIDARAPRWRGQRVINLNKHPYDLTMMRNRLSYTMIGQVPHLTTLETVFVHLFVDGEDKGLFTHVENPGKQFLRRHGLDARGTLYKAQDFLFSRYLEVILPMDDPAYDKQKFEKFLEIKGNPDHNALIPVLEDINNWDRPIRETMEKHFDLDNYMYWMATNILLGNSDTTSQNFMLYLNPLDKHWRFIHWDCDGTWGFYTQPDQNAAGFSTPRSREGLANWWSITFHQRILEDENLRARLLDTVDELYKGPFSEENVRPFVEQYRQIAAPFVTRKPDTVYLPFYPHPGDDNEQRLQLFNAEVERLVSRPGYYYDVLQKSLHRPMPVWIAAPEPVGPGSNEWVFSWDESFMLDGGKFTFDLQVARRADFDKDSMVINQEGLVDLRKIQLPWSPEPGGYFFRVIVRATGDPANNWQIPYDDYWDDEYDKLYTGCRKFTVE